MKIQLGHENKQKKQLRNATVMDAVEFISNQSIHLQKKTCKMHHRIPIAERKKEKNEWPRSVLSYVSLLFILLHPLLLFPVFPHTLFTLLDIRLVSRYNSVLSQSP